MVLIGFNRRLYVHESLQNVHVALVCIFSNLYEGFAENILLNKIARAFHSISRLFTEIFFNICVG